MYARAQASIKLVYEKSDSRLAGTFGPYRYTVETADGLVETEWYVHRYLTVLYFKVADAVLTVTFSGDMPTDLTRLQELKAGLIKDTILPDLNEVAHLTASAGRPTPYVVYRVKVPDALKAKGDYYGFLGAWVKDYGVRHSLPENGGAVAQVSPSERTAEVVLYQTWNPSASMSGLSQPISLVQGFQQAYGENDIGEDVTYQPWLVPSLKETVYFRIEFPAYGPTYRYNPDKAMLYDVDIPSSWLALYIDILTTAHTVHTPEEYTPEEDVESEGTYTSPEMTLGERMELWKSQMDAWLRGLGLVGGLLIVAVAAVAAVFLLSGGTFALAAARRGSSK
jgi:hypothetical protein